MRYFFGLAICLFTGCNTIEITKIRNNSPQTEEQRYYVVSDILDKSFTPEAGSKIRNIKIYEGLHICSYVVGVNFWSDFISFITFNGIGRKIISSQGTLSDGDPRGTIVHEYVHQLDDMDRDGEIEIIDQNAFAAAFLRMQCDASLSEAAAKINEKADHFITNIFGIGPMSEAIAYTASWIVENPDLCPLYMHQVFRDILVVSRYKVSCLTHS